MRYFAPKCLIPYTQESIFSTHYHFLPPPPSLPPTLTCRRRSLVLNWANTVAKAETQRTNTELPFFTIQVFFSFFKSIEFKNKIKYNDREILRLFIKDSFINLSIQTNQPFRQPPPSQDIYATLFFAKGSEIMNCTQICFSNLFYLNLLEINKLPNTHTQTPRHYSVLAIL